MNKKKLLPEYFTSHGLRYLFIPRFVEDSIFIILLTSFSPLLFFYGAQLIPSKYFKNQSHKFQF